MGHGLFWQQLIIMIRFHMVALGCIGVATLGEKMKSSLSPKNQGFITLIKRNISSGPSFGLCSSSSIIASLGWKYSHQN